MQRRSQAGNAIMFVLMGLVLFAALMYTISRTGRTSQNMTIGTANIAAQSVLNFAEKINNAVYQVTAQNDCRVSKISFDGPSEISGYNNTSSPGNNKCHVFETRGGAANYDVPPAAALDQSKSSEAGFGKYVFVGNVCVDNVGTGSYTTCASDSKPNEELLMVLPWINAETCRGINQILKHTTIMDDSGSSFNPNLKFTGSYGDAYAIGKGGFTAYAKGCFESLGSPPGAGYHFYYALIPR